MHQQLSDTDRTLLSFLREDDRFLYCFLDAGHFPTYNKATPEMRRLVRLGWAATGWSEDRSDITYRITDLGRQCLETGLALEVMPEPQSGRFFWQRNPN